MEEEKGAINPVDAYSYECTLSDRSMVTISRDEKDDVSGLWDLMVTPPGDCMGASISLTDEQMRVAVRLVESVRRDYAGQIFGGVVEDHGARAAELERMLENVETEYEETREENERLSEENDAFRMKTDHQFADVYFELRRLLGIDSPLSEASVIDAVSFLIESANETRGALDALVRLKIYKAQKGADQDYLSARSGAWARAFKAVGKSKAIEMGLVKLNDSDVGKSVESASSSSLVQEEAYKSVIRTMERHKKIRDEVDAGLRNMERMPWEKRCEIEWIRDVLNRINELADGRTLLFGKDAPAIPEEFRSDELRKLYEHMVRGQGQAFREVKARFKAIYEAARREMDIIGSDPHDNRTLNALDRIKNIACGSVKVEPESK